MLLPDMEAVFIGLCFERLADVCAVSVISTLSPQQGEHGEQSVDPNAH